MKHHIEHNDEQWLVSRRAFLKYATLTGIAVQLPWLTSCGSDESIDFSTDPYSKDQFRSLRTLMEILFPEAGDGPGALTLNADKYFLWAVNDDHFDPEVKDKFVEDMNRLDEIISERFNLQFFEIGAEDQAELVAELAKIDWSRKWFSRTLTLIFEALLLDPAYNVNPDGIGWDWLQHDPGMPRPSGKLLYPQILNRHEV